MTARDWMLLVFMVLALGIYGLLSWYSKKKFDHMDEETTKAMRRLVSFMDQEAARMHE